MSGSDQPRVAALQDSLKNDKPPAYATGPLEAHWQVGKGNFARALDLVRNDASKDAAWVRAHLHRRKGETTEAGAWYGKAGRPTCVDPVDEEWGQIAAGLLLHI